jgi:hypothetical protein
VNAVMNLRVLAPRSYFILFHFILFYIINFFEFNELNLIKHHSGCLTFKT